MGDKDEKWLDWSICVGCIEQGHLSEVTWPFKKGGWIDKGEKQLDIVLLELD